jgi:pimeloyl-ACP methyl ester carboxylesterase
MRRETPTPRAAPSEARVRRGYFECRYGQLHVHNSMPPGGGFEEGRALLCLHDWPGSGRAFARFLSLIGQDRSAYAPDLPGFGESDAPPAAAAIADYAAALGDFLDNMRLRQLDVLAHRAAVPVAGELALSRATQVNRLILLSVPLLTEPERLAAAARAPASADAALRPPDGQRWAWQAAAQYPLRERLARLTQRVLVLRPRDDLWEATARVRDVLPAARVLELESAGEELLAGAAARTAELAREFLRG